MPEPIEIPPPLLELVNQLLNAVPARRGSVSERFVRCGKKGCPCHEKDEARHGPYYSATRVVDGKTSSRWLSAEEATIVRRQVEAGQQLRNWIEAFWTASERWADAELDARKAASTKAAEKRGSRPNSARRSHGKSKPS